MKILYPNEDGHYIAEEDDRIQCLWTPYGIAMPWSVQTSNVRGLVGIGYLVKDVDRFTVMQRAKVDYLLSHGLEVEIIQRDD